MIVISMLTNYRTEKVNRLGMGMVLDRFTNKHCILLAFVVKYGHIGYSATSLRFVLPVSKLHSIT